jgi:glycosyltransferase involved in cell wall biosynthesis
MTNPPLASIIVNNYNYARFLREAVDSALSSEMKTIQESQCDF